MTETRSNDAYSFSATDASGTLIGINAYDEYGIPGASNIGRFQYTGQMWLPEANVTYSKARNLLVQEGVFAQTDPTGPADDPNPYQYALNDPVNFVDPTGLVPCLIGDICITALGPLWEFFHHNLFEPRPPRDPGCAGNRRACNDSDTPEPLHFIVRDFAFCPADKLFAQFRQPGNSAPGAPYAQTGTHQRVPLALNNYITQRVNVASRTITNVTERQHWFYHGSVTISVQSTWFGSSVTIEGRGTNPSLLNYLEDSIGGAAIFRGLATRATVACTAKAF